MTARFERNGGHDGLRGLACLLIFLAAYPLAFGRWIVPADSTETFARYLASLGRAGLELCFVLFGLWLYPRVRASSFHFAGFLGTRARRALPTYWVALAAAVIVLRATDATPSWQRVIANALLVPSWVGEKDVLPGVSALTAGVFALLALPFLARLLRLGTAPKDVRLYAIAGMATAILVASFAGADVLPLMMFVVGFLLAETAEGRRASAEGPRAEKVWTGSIALGVGLPVAYCIAEGSEVFGVSQSPWLAELLRTLWMSAVLYAVVRGATAPRTYLARFLQLRPLRWLGAMAFSWYLVHALVLAALAEGFGPGGAPVGGEPVYWLLLPVTFAITVLAGGLLYVKVERRPLAEPVDEDVPDGTPVLHRSGPALRATPIET